MAYWAFLVAFIATLSVELPFAGMQRILVSSEFSICNVIESGIMLKFHPELLSRGKKTPRKSGPPPEPSKVPEKYESNGTKAATAAENGKK